MTRFSDIKVGDYVLVNFEGDVRRGEVTQVQREDKQVCVNNGIQDFWYEMDEVEQLPITDEELSNLKFRKTTEPNGNVKYAKGAFRILVPGAGDFSRMELWYRDETRHIHEPIPVNVLQNHFLAMTKVHLDDSDFDA